MEAAAEGVKVEAAVVMVVVGGGGGGNGGEDALLLFLLPLVVLFGMRKAGTATIGSREFILLFI